MALPKIEAPKYSCKLPVCGLEVEYRPFLSQEERILLMASESKDPASYIRAMKDVVSACTFGVVDANTLAPVDLEYLFLNLRSKAVGESVTIKFKCAAEPCEHELMHDICFDDVIIEHLDEYNENKKIEIQNGVGLVMKAPTADLALTIQNSGKTQAEKMFSMIKNCIDYIYDEEQVYKPADYKGKELDEFIDSLPVDVMRKISKFFEELPKLTYHKSVVCSVCGHENKVDIEGVGDFFT